MIDLSIVIVNYNTENFLSPCLTSIYENTEGVNFEIIVVDNLSSDGSVETIKSKFKTVILIENKYNLGFSKANNQGIEQSRGELILILNPDTIILKNSMSLMVNFLNNNPEISVVGPKILNPNKTIQYECARNLPTLSSEFFYLTRLHKIFPNSRITGNYLMSYWNHNEPRQVNALSGACFMIRKTVMKEFLFDEGFFMFAEDTDLFFRLKKNNKKIYFFPVAEIIHEWGGSYKKKPYKMIIRSNLSMFKYFYKHYGVGRAILYRIIVIIASLLMQIVCVLLIGLAKEPKKTSQIFRVYNSMFLWAIGLIRGKI